MKIIHRVSIFTILFFLCAIHLARSRSIKGETNLESDGLELDPKIEMVNYVEASTVTCKPVYGFLPCTTNIWGQLFMIVIYQYLLSLGGSYVSAGSDLFFQLTGPGIFGASLFHLLPTFPQLSLIIGKYFHNSFLNDYSIMVAFLSTSIHCPHAREVAYLYIAWNFHLTNHYILVLLIR